MKLFELFEALKPSEYRAFLKGYAGTYKYTLLDIGLVVSPESPDNEESKHVDPTERFAT